MQYKDKFTGLTAAKLRKILRYNPKTGHFYWLVSGTGRGSAKRIAGERAGTKTAKGWRVELPGTNFGYLMHRLAWLYMTGRWPKDQIDHVDEDWHNNRWKNLREADNGRNQCNRGLRPHNKSGVTGVLHGHNGRNNWYAECTADGVRVLGKWFRTKREAVAARKAAVAKHHGEFGR